MLLETFKKLLELHTQFIFWYIHYVQPQRNLFKIFIDYTIVPQELRYKGTVLHVRSWKIIVMSKSIMLSLFLTIQLVLLQQPNHIW